MKTEMFDRVNHNSEKIKVEEAKAIAEKIKNDRINQLTDKAIYIMFAIYIGFMGAMLWKVCQILYVLKTTLPMP